MAGTTRDEGVPYVAHLLAVAALVLEDGGDEDEAIAALLHDAAEDQGGRATLETIRRDFGPRVADIVEGCSDTLDGETPDGEKPPWRPRKEAYVAHLASASPSVRRVAAADKLHNLTSLLADLRSSGDQAFDRFHTSTPGDQVWFYKACGEALVRAGDGVLAARVADEALRLEDAAITLGLIEAPPEVPFDGEQVMVDVVAGKLDPPRMSDAEREYRKALREDMKEAEGRRAP